MPLGGGFYGTNLDGTENHTYCKFCYRNGDFTEQNMTVGKMIELSVENMIEELGFTEEKARDLANEVIPNLERWKA